MGGKRSAASFIAFPPTSRLYRWILSQKVEALQTKRKVKEFLTSHDIHCTRITRQHIQYGCTPGRQSREWLSQPLKKLFAIRRLRHRTACAQCIMYMHARMLGSLVRAQCKPDHWQCRAYWEKNPVYYYTTIIVYGWYSAAEAYINGCINLGWRLNPLHARWDRFCVSPKRRGLRRRSDVAEEARRWSSAAIAC